MKGIVHMLLIAVVLIGGCFDQGCTLMPPKEDMKEIGAATVTAFSKSAVESITLEIKKGLAEGGISKEKIEEVATAAGQRAAGVALDSFQAALEKKQKDAQDKGESVPIYVTIGLLALKFAQEFKRDGFFKKTPLDVNHNGIPDEQEVPSTRPA